MKIGKQITPNMWIHYTAGVIHLTEYEKY